MNLNENEGDPDWVNCSMEFAQNLLKVHKLIINLSVCLVSRMDAKGEVGRWKNCASQGFRVLIWHRSLVIYQSRLIFLILGVHKLMNKSRLAYKTREYKNPFHVWVDIRL